MTEAPLDDHPLLLEIQSLRASVAQFQEEAHASAVKLQRHSLDVARSHERAVQLERENDVLRSELALLRANPHSNAQFSPAESRKQVQELTLSLRRLSHKLSLTEDALLAKTTEHLSAQAQSAKAAANAEKAYELGARVRGREEESLSRQRDLELKVRKLEEQLKMSDGVIQEYAALVREMEASRSSSETEKHKDLASSLEKEKSSLDLLLSEFKTESQDLHTKLDKFTAELELCKAELDAEKKIHETLLGELGRSKTELQKLQLEDATAAKMVSRYMQFSQTSTNDLLTTLTTLQTRHSATISTLTSQNHVLSTQLRSLESQNERLRSALDELGGEIMKETYGRRREVALRIKMGGREERVVEGLRRWVRRGDELLGRVRTTEDDTKAPAAHLDALLDMAQHARILLESIDEGMLDEQSALSLSSGKARTLVVQLGLQGLLDELKELTERRVMLEKQVAEMRDVGMLDAHTNGNGYVADEPPQVPEKTRPLETAPLLSEMQPPPSENGDVHPLPPAPSDEVLSPSNVVQESASDETSDPSETQVANVISDPSIEERSLENEEIDHHRSTFDSPPEATHPLDIPPSRTPLSTENVSVDDSPPASTLLSTDDHRQSPKPENLQSQPLILVDSESIETEPVIIQPFEPQETSVPIIPDSSPATLPQDDKQQDSFQASFVQPEAVEAEPLDTGVVELKPSEHPSKDFEHTLSTLLPATSSETSYPPTNSVSFPSSSTPLSSSPPSIPLSALPTPAPIPNLDPKEETEPPKPHPLLAELARVSKRYDDLQRAFRDCHLALEGLKASLGSTTFYGYQTASAPLASLSTATQSHAIPLDVLRAALGRLDDYTEDARVELEIRIGDEALLAKGYEALLSVPGALAPAVEKRHQFPPLNGNGAEIEEEDHDPTQSEVEQQIEAFVSGNDPAVRKARDIFTRKLEDVQHDIAALKRAIHDPDSFVDSEQPLPSASVQQTTSSATFASGGGWSSWIRAPSPRSSSPAPTPQSSTFGTIMTSPRLRQSPSTSSFQSIDQARSRKTSFFGFGAGSSEPVKDPLAPLGLKVPMPSFGVGTLGSAGLGPGGFGSGYGLVSPTSPIVPATRSRTVSSTMYMLGLGSAGSGGPGKMARSASGASSSLGLSRQSSMISLSSASTHSRYASEEKGEDSVSEEVVEMTEDEDEEGEEDTDVE